jgi:hypothetical protein
MAFYWDDQRLRVSEIIASWRLPEGLHFRVLTECGQLFELFYHVSQDAWTIQIR